MRLVKALTVGALTAGMLYGLRLAGIPDLWRFGMVAVIVAVIIVVWDVKCDA